MQKITWRFCIYILISGFIKFSCNKQKKQIVEVLFHFPRITKLIFPVLLFLLFFACNPRNKIEKVVNDFPRVDTLRMQDIDIPGILLSPTHLFVAKNYLVVYQMERDPYFYFFDLPSGNFVFSGGNLGQGPNDFIKPDARFFYSTENGFKIFENNGNAIKELEIQDKNLITVHKEIIKPYQNMAISNLLILPNHKICYANTLMGNSEYYISDPNGENPQAIGQFPDWYTKSDEDEMNLFIYIKNEVVNPANGKFMAFYAYFRKFRLFDINGNLLKEVSVNTPGKFPQYTKDRSKSSIAYSFPWTDGTYVYVICKNKKIADKKPNRTELQVWDWDGNPVAQLWLDKPIDYFTISLDYNKLYAVDSEVENKIYVCDLPLK